MMMKNSKLIKYSTIIVIFRRIKIHEIKKQISIINFMFYN